MNKSGRKPFKRALTYMKRMVSTGKWKANKRIPTLATIAKRTGTSIVTTRKAIHQMEYERLIDNNGSLGFCVIPTDLTRLFHADKQRYYLRLIKLNLDTIELLESGGIPLGKYIILSSPPSLVIRNVLSGETTNTTWKDLEASIQSPILLDSLIPLSGLALAKAREKYFTQTKLRDAAKVILKSKEIPH